MNLAGFAQRPHEISESIAFDEESRGEVRKQTTILQPLDSSHRRGDGLVYHEEIVHVTVARGLVGRMNHAFDHAKPIGSNKQVGFKVPITTSNPRPLQSPEADGSLLQDVHISAGQSFAILEVHIKHVDPTFAHSSDPRDLQSMLQVLRQDAERNRGDAHASPRKSGPSS